MNCIRVFEYIVFLWIVSLLRSEHDCAVAQMPTQTNVSGNSRVGLEDDDMEDFVPYQGERFSVFDWNLFRVMGKKYSGNLLVSPISAKLAMVLLYEGAQDQTAHELAGVLQLPVSRPATRDRFSSILRSLHETSPTYMLDIGSRIYIDMSVSTRQRYAAIVKTFYEADVIHTNINATHVVADHVNTWVRNVTHGSIDKMIEDDDNIKDTVMIVLNALFFKGMWRRNFFLPNHTHLGRFYTDGNQYVQVPYMMTVSRLYYSESSELNAKILRLPYDGHKYAMYIVLPIAANGLDQLINEINPFILTRHVWLMQELPIEVIIPKFKFDFTSHLESTLRELGIRDIFDNTAMLTGIALTKRASRRLMVSDVIQKTGIEVDEKGTTAYAATDVQLGNKMADQTFHANHPFVFFIEDETTGTILYVGKVTNPIETCGSTETMQPQLPSRINVETPNIAPPAGQLAIPTPEERYNFFNTELLQMVNKEMKGNVILSPASAKLALMMLLEGTGGRTRREILSTLRLPPEEIRIRSIVTQTVTSLKNAKNGTELDTANRLWTNLQTKLSSNYSDVLQQYYKADVKSVDFADATNTADAINTWVRQATQDKVQQLISNSNLDASTQLLLTSVLYFKGRWQTSFDKSSTKVHCFHVPNYGCHNVSFMQHISKYRYAYIPSLDSDVVEIPYSDGKTSMLILLPNKAENDQDLQILSKDLSYIAMSTLLASLENTEILLAIPKFTIKNKLDLRASLTQMGIRDIFQTTANFSRLDPEHSLYVTNILQHAMIEVDEEGTIAAAVTAIGIIPFIASPTPEFRANRPFLFAIVDLQTNGTLFAGRFMEPEPVTLNNPQA